MEDVSASLGHSTRVAFASNSNDYDRSNLLRNLISLDTFDEQRNHRQKMLHETVVNYLGNNHTFDDQMLAKLIENDLFPFSVPCEQRLNSVYNGERHLKDTNVDCVSETFKNKCSLVETNNSEVCGNTEEANSNSDEWNPLRLEYALWTADAFSSRDDTELESKYPLTWSERLVASLDEKKDVLKQKQNEKITGSKGKVNTDHKEVGKRLTWDLFQENLREKLENVANKDSSEKLDNKNVKVSRRKKRNERTNSNLERNELDDLKEDNNEEYQNVEQKSELELTDVTPKHDLVTKKEKVENANSTFAKKANVCKYGESLEKQINENQTNCKNKYDDILHVNKLDKQRALWKELIEKEDRRREEKDASSELRSRQKWLRKDTEKNYRKKLEAEKRAKEKFESLLEKRNEKEKEYEKQADKKSKKEKKKGQKLLKHERKKQNQ